MAQRREQISPPTGSTTLVLSTSLGPVNTCRGNKDSTATQSLAFTPSSHHVQATGGGHKMTGHNRELSARCDNNSSPRGKTKEVSGQTGNLLQSYLKLKEDKVVALRTWLNPATTGDSATEVQRLMRKQDGSQMLGVSHLRPGNASASSFGRVCNWAHASPGFLEHLENMWKQKAFREVEQFREDLDSFEYTMPLKTEQQMKALNRSQLTEYIKLLHKDNEYIGQLAVDSKTKLQRMSAETDYLNQQVQSLKQELEVQAALYLDKLNRHQHKAV